MTQLMSSNIDEGRRKARKERREREGRKKGGRKEEKQPLN